MTTKQKALWLKIAGTANTNLEAREMYDEACKLIDMEDKIILGITQMEDGLEVKLSELAYGNLALIGLLEKIKFNLLNQDEAPSVSKFKTNYDA